MSEFSFYLSQVIDGIAYGSIYGIFSMAIVILYRANKLLNFAQTELATLCVILMVFLLKVFPFWPAFCFTLVLSFSLGALLHLTIMRHITERRNIVRSSEPIISIGFFVIFNNISAFLIGDEPQPFPSMFGQQSLAFYGVNISQQSIGILAITLFLIISIHLVFKYTRLGLKFEAVAENITAARLRGVHASNTLSLAWGISAMIGALGAILIAPIQYLSPSMLLSIFGYSLMAVIIGGLESPLGALVGGIFIGVVENLASNLKFIGSDLKFVVVFIFLIIILLVKPRGLWGRREARRV